MRLDGLDHDLWHGRHERNGASRTVSGTVPGRHAPGGAMQNRVVTRHTLGWRPVEQGGRVAWQDSTTPGDEQSGAVICGGNKAGVWSSERPAFGAR